MEDERALAQGDALLHTAEGSLEELRELEGDMGEGEI